MATMGDEDRCDLEMENTSNNIQQAGVEAPQVGMSFKNLKDLYDFYKEYGKCQGFGIAKRGGRRDDVTGEYRWMTITCSRVGQHRSKGSNILAKRASVKSGCGARVCCAIIEGQWVITKALLDHNHEISPESACFIRQHRTVDAHSRRLLESNDLVGLRPTESVKAIVFQVGGHERLPCLSVDLTSHVKKVRRFRLEGGDAEAVHKMFANLQTESSDFVYVINPDKEGKLKHVFWADGRCRAAYKEFSDVITFDTTYLVNKYDMPFCAFVGVNHHRHSILLGCALLNNEKIKTYKWLFETWLKCMDDKQPDAIITDQCQSIGEAIKIVFPNSHHRWCMWHISSKLPKKLGSYANHEDIKDTFIAVVNDSSSAENFEQKWVEMLTIYPELEGNAWLSSLYENRKRWAPVYLDSYFWAGMSSTQRSESMHSFFNGFVNSRTTLQKFVEQYQLAVKAKVEKEAQHDHKSANTQIPCVTRLAFETQLRAAYTNKIFKQVQKEMTDIMYCDTKVMGVEGRFIIYAVSELLGVAGASTRWRSYIVHFASNDDEIWCNCKLFESKGLLCAHIFKVMMCNNVVAIPERYILRRWRKDVVRRHSHMKIGLLNFSEQMHMTKELENVFYSSIQMAVQDTHKYEFMMEGLRKQHHELQNWCGNRHSIEDDNSYPASVNESCQTDGEGIHYRDPNSVRRRGRPKTKRYLATFEKNKRRRPITRSQTHGRSRATNRPSSSAHPLPHQKIVENLVMSRLDIRHATESLAFSKEIERTVAPAGSSTPIIWGPATEI